MGAEQSAWLLIAIAVVAANIPWLNNRIFFIKESTDGQKKAIWSWLEVVFLYLVTGVLAFGFESKINGETYQQGWEFYAITFCLFIVLSLPGFLYKYNLKHQLART